MSHPNVSRDGCDIGPSLLVLINHSKKMVKCHNHLQKDGQMSQPSPAPWVNPPAAGKSTRGR